MEATTQRIVGHDTDLEDARVPGLSPVQGKVFKVLERLNGYSRYVDLDKLKEQLPLRPDEGAATPATGPAPEPDDEEDDEEEHPEGLVEASDSAEGIEGLIEEATRRGWTVEQLNAHKSFNGGVIKMSYAHGAPKVAS